MTKTKQETAGYEMVVIGASAGGIEAVTAVLECLPRSFMLPVLVVIHLHADSRNYSLLRSFEGKISLGIKEVEDKGTVQPGTVYFAPPNYHVLVEDDRTLSLSVDAKVNFSRPSIDVLFESAADVYREKVIGVVLTGASHDGAAGLKKIKEAGGLVLVQDPALAQAEIMPRAALAACNPDRLLSLAEIGAELAEFGRPG